MSGQAVVDLMAGDNSGPEPGVPSQLACWLLVPFGARLSSAPKGLRRWVQDSGQSREVSPGPPDDGP